MNNSPPTSQPGPSCSPDVSQSLSPDPSLQSFTHHPQPSKPPSSSSSSDDPLSRQSSTFWSSWISPSSSSAVAASLALEKRSKHKRPTFEEFRAHEPPQARLIRLRGLFDTLLNKNDEFALAGGRAREEWIKTARKARYGAGGSLARGSLAPFDIRNSTVGFEDCIESSGSSPSKDKLVAFPSSPSQSYAKELLSQCRSCRDELQADRVKQAAALRSKSDQRQGSKWEMYSWFSNEKSARIPNQSSNPNGDNQPKLSDPNSIATHTKPNDAPNQQSPSLIASSIASLFGSSDLLSKKTHHTSESTANGLDHEAGWAGSRVWGLSAVGRKQREANQLYDEKVRNGEQVQDDGGATQRQIEWEGFLAYADIKERELYKIFIELDKNGDMKLDAGEIRTALGRAGIEIPQTSLDDFVASLTCSRSTSLQPCKSTYVTFPEFRDYLLLLPRKLSVSEIYRFYQVRKAFGLFGMSGIFAELAGGWGKTERGATAVNADGEVSLAGEEKKRESPTQKEARRAEKVGKMQEAAAVAAVKAVSEKADPSGQHCESPDFKQAVSEAQVTVAASASAAAAQATHTQQKQEQGAEEEEEEEDDSDMIPGAIAVKFLIAGGVAGAVSRTATAPFDRLKIYLMTVSRTNDLAHLSGAQKPTVKAGSQGFGALQEALTNLYRQGGGVRAFWTGNGLNCVKIFPESAIKFLSYETAKRAFAKYVDHVSDSRDISGTSRFLSGGLGGITSQLAIYPIETLKTRLMSSQGSNQSLKGNALLFKTAKDMWKTGALRTYYRGLTAGLIGVFPYSAIDMSAFEGIKLFYIKYTGTDPGVLALLCFGSISGSVGASTVYPLNLIRTRLQAAGTPAHPNLYAGFMDAVQQTYRNEGVVGFYRGLLPTLAKVVPAVSISYVVYEHSKRRLGVL